MEWTHCPICNKKIDTSGTWNKFNREVHVKACIKRKKAVNEKLNNKNNKRKLDFGSPKISSFLSSL